MANQVTITVNINNLEDSIKKMEELSSRITAINGKTTNLHVRVTGAEQANSQLSRIADTISNITNLASGMSSAISGFASGITNAFSGMSSMFNTDFMSVAYRTVAHQITNSFMSAIPAVIQRYDIMSTFTDYMNLAGVDSETANAALSRVDQTIRGIPIGLDEAAFRLRRYQMYLGDIDRATNLTIGVQNAIMAGGASEQMRNTAYTQIDRLLATGKLSQARQWMSLFNGLGVSLRFLKEELALDPTASMQQVASDLASGAIATDDFLRAMERLADNEGLNQALTIYKGTIEAWMANIKNAIKRGGQAIMEAMDDVMTDQFGQGITGVLKTIRDQIDSISQSAANFIRQNPELVGTLGEIFGGIWQRIQSADFGGFIGKLVDNLGRLADIIFRIFDNLPDGFLSDFVSFAVILAGPLSLIFKTVSSGLPLIIGVFERMKDFDFADLIEKIVRQVEIFADVIARVLGLIPDGLLGDLMAFGLVWGKPLVGIINGISGALTNLFNGIGGMGGQGLFGGLGTLIRSLGQLMGYPMLGVVSGLAAGIGIIVYETKEYYRELEKVAELNFHELNPNFDMLVSDTEAMVANMKRTRDGWQTTIDTVVSQAETAHALVEEIRSTDKEIGNTEDIRERKSLIAEQEALIAKLGKVSDITLTLNPDTGRIDAESNAILNLADSYIELAKAKAIADAYEENLGAAYSGLFEAQSQRRKLADQRRNLYKQLTEQRVRRDVLQASTDRPNTDFSASGQYEFETTGERIADDLMAAEAAYNKTADEITTLDGEISGLDEMIANYTSDIDYFGEQIQESMAEAEEATGNSKIQENVQNIANSFDELATETIQSVNEMVSGFEAIEEESTIAMDTIQKNLQTHLDYLAHYQENLAKLIRFAYEHPEYDLTGTFSKLSELSPDDAAVWVASFAEGIEQATASGDYTALDAIFTKANKERIANEIVGQELQIIAQAGSDPTFLQTLFANNGMFGGGNLGQLIFGDDWSTVYEELNSVDLSDLEENVVNVATQYKDLQNEITNSSSTAEEAKDEINRAMSDINLRYAIAQVQLLAASLNALPTNKHVRVTYEQYGFSVPYASLETGIGHGDRGQYATGGYIYGPGIPALAIGTDTVPAMLTPGEYVVNRNAVNMFGQTFLEAVNGMDVGAAYDAMMARVSVPHGSTYNYYDNHATVNQNFYGNTGQGFSQKKAFKFVSAL